MCNNLSFDGQDCDVHDIDGLVQDCRNPIANALELLQSCTKPSICRFNLTSAKCFLFETMDPRLYGELYFAILIYQTGPL